MAGYQTGSYNPNWRGGKIKKNCVICNKPFLIIPSEKNLRKTCGDKNCINKNLSRQRIGNKNANYKPKIKKMCPICGKTFDVAPYRKDTAVYCSKDCKDKSVSIRFENPTERNKASEQAKIRWQDPEYWLNQSEQRKGISLGKEICEKIGDAHRGDKSHFWKGGISFEPYCQKFNKPLKRSNRERFHHKCQFPGCGKMKEENKNRDLCVHHVFTEKMACCETKIDEMEQLRNRLPLGVAKFGEPEFSEEEITHIRMMVPLCMSHHQKVKGEEMKNLPFEETIYRKHFVELIMNEYGGRCYETQNDEKTTTLAEA